MSLTSARILKTFPTINEMNTDCMSWVLMVAWTALSLSFFHHFLHGAKHSLINRMRFSSSTPKFNIKREPRDWPQTPRLVSLWWCCGVRIEGRLYHGKRERERKGLASKLYPLHNFAGGRSILVSRSGDETLWTRNFSTRSDRVFSDLWALSSGKSCKAITTRSHQLTYLTSHFSEKNKNVKWGLAYKV